MKPNTVSSGQVSTRVWRRVTILVPVGFLLDELQPRSARCATADDNRKTLLPISASRLKKRAAVSKSVLLVRWRCVVHAGWDPLHMQNKFVLFGCRVGKA